MPTKLTEPINFNDWKCRASASGKLNTNPPGKTPMEKYLKCLEDIKDLENRPKLITSQQEKLAGYKSELHELLSHKNDINLSATTKSYLHEIYWELRTGVRKDIHSGYLEHGKLGEESAISLCSELDEPELFEMGEQIYSKCTKPRQFNDHFSGECDIEYSPVIIDVKCSWDVHTYYQHVNELNIKGEASNWTFENNVWSCQSNIENDDYECQGIVYIELYGMNEFWLRYCLVNMPDILLKSELKSILWKYGNIESDEYLAAAMEFQRKHKFDHLPIELRVTTFSIKRDLDKYINLCRKVEKSREYLNWYAKEMFYVECPKKRPTLQDTIVGVIVDNLNKQMNDWNNVNIAVSGKVVETESFDWKKSLQDQFLEKLGQDAEDLVCGKNQQNSEINNLDKKITEYILGKEDVVNEVDQHYDMIPDSLENDIKDVVEELTEPSKPFGDGSENKILKDTLDKANNFIENYVDTDNLLYQKIQSLKTPEDCTMFYMENFEDVQGTNLEKVFMDKSAEIRTVQKQKPASKPEQTKPIQSPQRPVFKSPEPIQNNFTGNELYNISNGTNDIATKLDFEAAKNFIKTHIENGLKQWNTISLCRTSAATFGKANKLILERDLAFKEIISKMVQIRLDELIEIQKKIIAEQASKM